MTQPSSAAERGPASSTNAGLGAFLWRAGGPSSRCLGAYNPAAGDARRGTPHVAGLARLPPARATAAVLSVFGRELRNCSSWRCSCRIGSGIGSVLLRFTSAAAPSRLNVNLQDKLRDVTHPCRKLTLFPGGTRHGADTPISEKVVWHACRRAAQRCGVNKPLHPHTLRQAGIA
jgi:hypothetical protein